MGASASPALVRLAHRLRGSSAPYRPRLWPRAGKGWAGPGPAGSGWAREGLQCDLEQGRAHRDGPHGRATGAPVLWKWFPRTVLWDSHPLIYIKKGRERSKHLSLKTTNKLVVRCLLSSQGAQGESFSISFQQNQERICFQIVKISLDLANPPQICCLFPRECRDWWLRFRMSCFVTQFPLSNE